MYFSLFYKNDINIFNTIDFNALSKKRKSKSSTTLQLPFDFRRNKGTASGPNLVKALISNFAFKVNEEVDDSAVENTTEVVLKDIYEVLKTIKNVLEQNLGDKVCRRLNSLFQFLCSFYYIISNIDDLNKINIETKKFILGHMSTFSDFIADLQINSNGFAMKTLKN